MIREAARLNLLEEPSMRQGRSWSLAVLLLFAPLLGCGGGGGGGSSVGPSGTPTPAVLVDQSIEVFNSNGAFLGKAVYSQVQRGNTLTVTATDLSAKGVTVSSINSGFLVARQPASGGNIGDFISNTTGGTLSVPINGTPVSIYGMNSSNGTDYGCAYSQGFGQRLPVRFATVRRLKAGESFPVAGNVIMDPPAGFEGIIPGALDQLNATLTVNGIRYGSLSWVGDSDTANFAGGFGSPVLADGQRVGGVASQGKFLLTLDQPRFFIGRAAVEEALEVYAGGDDICGYDSVVSLFAPGIGLLTERGKDYVRFAALFR